MFLAVSRHDGGDFLREVEDSGLTLTQCRTLTVLSSATADERLSARELSAQIGVTESTFSRAIDALVKRGLATRAEHELDRRQRQIDVTDEGARLVSSLVATKRAGVENFAASLNAEQQRALGSAIDALFENPAVVAAYEQIQRRRPA